MMMYLFVSVEKNKTKKFHFLATKEYFKRGLEEIRTAESFIASKERLLKVGKLFSSSPELSYSLVWSRSCYISFKGNFFCNQ